MGYHCPEKGCDVVIEGNDKIQEILEHEKIHFKKKKIVQETEVHDCPNCNGTGKIEETYLIERDADELSRTD